MSGDSASNPFANNPFALNPFTRSAGIGSSGGTNGGNATPAATFDSIVLRFDSTTHTFDES